MDPYKLNDIMEASGIKSEYDVIVIGAGPRGLCGRTYCRTGGPRGAPGRKEARDRSEIQVKTQATGLIKEERAIKGIRGFCRGREFEARSRGWSSERTA